MLEPTVSRVAEERQLPNHQPEPSPTRFHQLLQSARASSFSSSFFEFSLAHFA
jgi:hypothetical protein